MAETDIDVVGNWTEIKLNILKEYSQAYAKILSKHSYLKHYYIDGFAGAGLHISKTTGQEIEGSPSIALNLQPGFSHYHFIDLDGNRAEQLRSLAAGRTDVTVYHGDCNAILLNKVFPQCQRKDYRRALCLLDPYKLNPDWNVVQTAGSMESIEIFLNFMIMDANMNVLKHNRDKVTTAQVERMRAFWGDDSWQQAGYTTEPGLFGDMEKKASNEAIVKAYRKRLQEVAKFKYVPEPLPMRNSNGAVIYYLFFASNNETGAKIAKGIFNKYRIKGAAHGS